MRVGGSSGASSRVEAEEDGERQREREREREREGERERARERESERARERESHRAQDKDPNTPGTQHGGPLLTRTGRKQRAVVARVLPLGGFFAV